MPFECSVDENGEIVVVRLWGDVAFAQHSAARDEAVRLCIQRGIWRVLVDLRDLKPHRTMSTVGCYDFGEQLAQGAFPARTLMAGLMPTDKAAFQDVNFTATVAKNRGMLLQEFTTISEAHQWLLTQSTGPQSGQDRSASAEAPA